MFILWVFFNDFSQILIISMSVVNVVIGVYIYVMIGQLRHAYWWLFHVSNVIPIPRHFAGGPRWVYVQWSATILIISWLSPTGIVMIDLHHRGPLTFFGVLQVRPLPVLSIRWSRFREYMVYTDIHNTGSPKRVKARAPSRCQCRLKKN